MTMPRGSALTAVDAPPSPDRGDAELRSKDLWKVFGPRLRGDHPGREPGEAHVQDIKAKTGCAVAVRDVSFEVRAARCSSSWGSRARASPRWCAA